MKHRILRKKSPIPGVKTKIPLYPAARFFRQRSDQAEKSGGGSPYRPPTYPYCTPTASERPYRRPSSA